MKITNIEITSASYNNVSDLFCALVSMTMNDCVVVDGIRAAYSDEFPDKNDVQYPDGFHVKGEEEQNLMKEQILSEIAKQAKQHDRKRLHDAIRKIMTNTNNKK